MTAKPRRIQRKRTKGWRKPPNTVCVDRSTRWGNRFRISPRIETGHVVIPAIETAEQAVALYREWLLGLLRINPGYLEPLRGKNLACWCPRDQPCHADVMLELANRPHPQPRGGAVLRTGG